MNRKKFTIFAINDIRGCLFLTIDAEISSNPENSNISYLRKNDRRYFFIAGSTNNNYLIGFSANKTSVYIMKYYSSQEFNTFDEIFSIGMKYDLDLADIDSNFCPIKILQ